MMVDFRDNTGMENVRTAGLMTVRAFGVRDGRAVCGAMRFAISTVFRLFRHFPGLSYRAWIECPRHAEESLHALPGPHDEVGGQFQWLVVSERHGPLVLA